METNCDDLLAAMHQRSEARMVVRDAVAEIPNNWQKKTIDPKSLEGRFLMAANRFPCSFHEIVSVDAGHTVTINDVLTGRAGLTP